MKYLKLFENFDLIKEDYLELKSIGKKLYSFLKSKGYVVRLQTEGENFLKSLSSRDYYGGKKKISKTGYPWANSDRYHLYSDESSIYNISAGLRKGEKGSKPSNPNVIISEFKTGNEGFCLRISVLSFYKYIDGFGGKRKVEDMKKKRELNKIVSDFLSKFSTIEVEIRKSRNEIDGFFVKSKE
jgi:hypothetical protein